MTKGLSRRSFLRNAGIAAAGALVGCNKVSDLAATAATKSKVANMGINGNIIPKWKGFNLSEFFQPDPYYYGSPTPDEWFKWMADWGFDFVRIPIAYPTYLEMKPNQKYISPDDVYKISQKKLHRIQEVVDQANRYGLHVSLNLHRAPGYCVSTGYQEPYNLWTDDLAMQAFCNHWGMWAEIFKNKSNNQISFDLLNEPCYRANVNDVYSYTSAVPGDLYRHVAQAACDRIRSIKPDPLIIADGNNGGADPVPELATMGIAQSCRGYWPYEISHYKAPWVYPDASYQPWPGYPGNIGGREYNREVIRQYYQPWIELVKQNVGVHCGECGAWKDTPHDIFLTWFGDVLDVLGEYGIGFALWEFSGDFGILNSNRNDVQYEDWYGHKLDKKLLTMLQSK